MDPTVFHHGMGNIFGSDWAKGEMIEEIRGNMRVTTRKRRGTRPGRKRQEGDVMKEVVRNMKTTWSELAISEKR
jgi:hypothetical protein